MSNENQNDNLDSSLIQWHIYYDDEESYYKNYL